MDILNVDLKLDSNSNLDLKFVDFKEYIYLVHFECKYLIF
jgi:hypothetical protein